MDASHHLMLEGRRRVGGPSRADGIKVPKGEEQGMHPPKTAGVFSLILSSGWLGAERSACDLAYAA